MLYYITEKGRTSSTNAPNFGTITQTRTPWPMARGGRPLCRLFGGQGPAGDDRGSQPARRRLQERPSRLPHRHFSDGGFCLSFCCFPLFTPLAFAPFSDLDEFDFRGVGHAQAALLGGEDVGGLPAGLRQRGQPPGLALPGDDVAADRIQGHRVAGDDNPAVAPGPLGRVGRAALALGQSPVAHGEPQFAPDGRMGHQVGDVGVAVVVVI